jgi:hypothetical protein
MDARRWPQPVPRSGLGAAVLALCVGACADARPARLDPRAHPGERFVVGRILVSRSGEPAAVTKPKSGWTRLFTSTDPLTTLYFTEPVLGERFEVSIENPQGWFAAHLPPATYVMSMGYYIWLFGTPARLHVPTDPERCYVGTLAVNLFAASSLAGGWARAAGGVIPTDDIDFVVVDQSGGAAAYAGMSLPLCAMSVTHDEAK